MNESPLSQGAVRKHSFLLIFLTALFCFRVGAQLLQRYSEVSFLPPFDDWESGVLPYWLLLTSQLIIIFLCVRITYQINAGTALPDPKMGKICLIFGIIYSGIMVFRLIAGATFAADHPWLAAKLPTLFHLVLASILLVVGHYNLKFGQRPAPQ